MRDKDELVVFLMNDKYIFNIFISKIELEKMFVLRKDMKGIKGLSWWYFF